MAAHTNPNLTKQPDQHQTRKDKEMQKEKRKMDCPNKTKTNHKNYLPKQKYTPQKNTKTNHTK